MGFLRRLFDNDKSRNNAMRTIASELNLKFTDLNDTGMHAQLSEFKLFDFGSSPKISNIMTESMLNSENYVFDYEYVVSTGKSSKIYKQTVFFINSKELSLPQFYQKPENILTKFLALLGFDDIDFINFPEYSDKYNLKGEYEDVIRYYFSKDVLELLTLQKDLYMEGMNYYLILYQIDKICSPTQIKSFRNLGLMLYKLFLMKSKDNEEGSDGTNLIGLVK
jgi:hypothetical protein